MTNEDPGKKIESEIELVNGKNFQYLETEKLTTKILYQIKS